LIEEGGLTGVICGKYMEGYGIDLFNAVCKRNLEGIVAKKKDGTYSTVSGWLKIKNPLYTQSERRHELFDSFKSKQKNTSSDSQKAACSIPPPQCGGQGEGIR
jgi:hypothetical protein